MRTLLFLLCLAVVPLRGNSPTDSPQSVATSRYAIGLTPFLEKSAKDDVYRRIVGMILEDIPLKSSLTIYDAYNLTTITRIEVPDARVFQSGNADFADCLIERSAHSAGCESTVTFDVNAAKHSGMRLIT